ncbi:hypothetical protein DFS33DRAFT_11134 [Desarmillaria ectypa]|nr:hypothetical protein DFS33DRAFT_11134 [Desarmillaria ectypa]
MTPTSRKRGRNEAVQDDMQNVVEARREALIEERQKRLESIYDRHDTLVREAFHMENFTLMLGYDPKRRQSRQALSMTTRLSLTFSILRVHPRVDELGANDGKLSQLLHTCLQNPPRRVKEKRAVTRYGVFCRLQGRPQ